MSIYGYARLVGYDEKLKLVPDILDKFTIEDGRIFTFTCARATDGRTGSRSRPRISATAGRT